MYEALGVIDAKERHDAVINVKGDLPTIDPAAIRAVLRPLTIPPSTSPPWSPPSAIRERPGNPDVVKAAVSFGDGATVGRALYFSRHAVPAGDGPLYHHIGIYAYRRQALERFVALPPAYWNGASALSSCAPGGRHAHRRRLVDTVPLGVDTPADLERARRMLAP